MKNVTAVVSFVTLYALFYQSAILMGLADGVILSLFALTPFLVIYMVYVVLKYGNPPSDTFEDQFYCDSDYKRNGPEEMSADV